MNEMDYVDHLTFAIHSLKPGSEFVITNGNYDEITWIVLDGAAPTFAEVEAEITKMKQNIVKVEAKRVIDKAAILAKLGITADEAKLLLG